MSKPRIISFLDSVTDTTLILPVTPESFEVSHGINIETINIHTMGDAVIAGYGTLPTFKVDCVFPAHDYPFNHPTANIDDPYSYVRKIEEWCDNRIVLRFIVSETMVNAPVLIEEITYGEKDGTGDVYAAITMRKYRELTSVQMSNTGNTARVSDDTKKTCEEYLIKPGDTLWSICRNKYGDPLLYKKVAKYNDIPNPNIIYAGHTLKLPDMSLL